MHFKRVALFLSFALLLTFAFLQSLRIRALLSENERLAHELKATQRVEIKPEQDLALEELLRLRKQESELLKLRGEVNVLRRQLRQAKAEKSGAQSDPAVSPVKEPVRKFSATAEITLQPGETAVTGGWETSPGKHTLVFATPTIISDTGEGDPNGTQITVSARFVELPQALFYSLGLGQSTEHEALKGSFGSDRMRQLLKQFEDDDAVLSLAAPRVSTLSGQQAQVSVLETKTINGNHFELGPTLDVISTKLVDGSIKMVLVPSLAMENAALSQ